MVTMRDDNDRGRTSLVGLVLVASAAIAMAVTATLAVRALDSADASQYDTPSPTPVVTISQRGD